jgi:peptidyl-prolyl cis-trans isomerase D
MVVIATLVIISFAYWGPSSYTKGRGGQVIYEVYGKKITQEEQARILNKMQVYGALGGGYYESLGTETQRNNPYSRMPQPEDSHDYFDTNSIVFEHEADAMGITATAEEIQEELLRTPAFQADGKFDVSRVDGIVQHVLQPNGFSKENLETFLAGAVRIRKVQDLLKSTASVTPEEVRVSLLDRNLVTEASYVSLKKDDFSKGITVSDEDLKKRYEEKKEQLKTAELRKVRFVAFRVPPTPAADPAKPAPEPDRAEQTKLLQKSVNAAYDFAQAIKKGRKFDELAAEQKLTIEETPSFTISEVPATLEASEEIGEAVFELKKESPVSAHLIGKKGAYVAMLPEAGITEPKQKTLEECKVQLTSEIQSERADEAMRKKGEELQKKIVELKKAGKSFTEACEAAGVKAVAHPSYSQSKPAQGQYSAQIQQAAVKLAPGDVSEFVPVNDGGLIVHLDQRLSGDEKSMEAEKLATANAMESYRGRSIFREWLKERRKAAGIPEDKAEPKQS